MAEDKKFPTEVIDLPSKGKLYSKDNPLSSGKIEIKYMTAREEDILTSQNLIKKGIVIETLLDSLIVTKGIKTQDLLLGDFDARMVAARILAYGPEYTVELPNPTTGERMEHTFNLADCPFKNLPKDVNGNEITVTLPVSKQTIIFKLLTGKEEKAIDLELKQLQKINSIVTPEMTTRLKHSIISVDGNADKSVIYSFVDNMLSKDSLYLRQQMTKFAPDIELQQEIEIGGESVMVDIPMTADFFWPKA